MVRPAKNQCQTTNSPLKKLRLKVRLTQEQLAKEIGVAASSISRWEKGGAEPTMTITQMKRFCQIVDLDLDDLPNSLSPFNSESDLIGNHQ